MMSALKKIITSEIRFILAWFFATRMVLTVIGVLSRIILDPDYPRHPDWHYSDYLWLDIWGIWDTGWYLKIAEHGYDFETWEGIHAFFPLYPLLIKVFSVPFTDPFIAGLVISNISLLVSCHFLYKLVDLDHGAPTARNAVKFLLLFPTAFIFSGAFSESLFLALSLFAFYQARAGNWLWAGTAGGFSSLTRPLGALIIFPLAYLYFKQIDFKWERTQGNILFLMMIPLGFALYSLYNYLNQGDFLAFYNAQSIWGRHLTNPLSSIYYNLVNSNPRTIIEIVFGLTALGLTIFSFRKVEFPYWMFGAYTILIPVFFGGLISMPRLMLPVFSFYIYFAHLGTDSAVDKPLSISMATLQCLLMVYWCTGIASIV